MDVLDKLALWGRRYDSLRNPRSGDYKFSLRDMLEDFQLKTILQLTAYVNGKAGDTFKPDPVRRLKISLLDEGSVVLGSPNAAWYEISTTAPSGDFAWFKVIARSSSGQPAGELRMLVAYRMPELYFKEDPIFASMADDAILRRKV